MRGANYGWSLGLWRLGMLVGLTILSMHATAETCGIDTIFFNGFQATSSLPDPSSFPGALSSPGSTASILGPPPAVAITQPADGSTIGTTSVQVVGTYTGPTNVGILVNGVMAYAYNGQFVAPAVALNAGSNSVNVMLTTMTGTSASGTATVTQAGSAPVVGLSASRPFGMAPVTITFFPSLGALPGNATLQSVAIDYDGDGTPDVSAPNLGQTFSHRYNQAGIFRVRATITDSNNQQYLADRWVVVEDVARRRGMLCDVFGYMKERLVAADLAAAGKALQQGARDRFIPMWTAAGAQLPTTVAQLGTIGTGRLGDQYAEFLVVRKKPDQTLSGFPLQYTMGPDGVWRISQM